MTSPDAPVALVPPVHDAMLAPATVDQLFFDVGHAAELLGITLKHAGARRAAPAAREPTLDDAHRALVARQVAAVQLRYRFAGEEWWDTLIHTPTGIRLVRISHTRAIAGDAP